MKKSFILLIRCCTMLALCCMMLAVSCSKKISEEDLSIYNPITFTFFSSDGFSDCSFDDPVAKAITAKTGVTLEIHESHASDSMAIPLMVANGRYDDFIYAKGDLTKLIDAEAVIALDAWESPDGTVINLIEKYGDNMKKLYGSELAKLKHSDGHIYSFGTYDVHNKILETSGSLQIQHAVLKEFGYPKIKTLNDYAELLRTYMKNHPTINGQPTIGLSLLTEGSLWYVGLGNLANYVIGLPDNGQWIVDNTTYEAQYKFLNPDMAIFFRWLNELYHDGTLDPESFTQTEEMWKAKITSGRVLGIGYPSWGYSDVRLQLVADGMPERTYAYLPVVADVQYRDPSLTDFGYAGGWGISISKNCKDVVRAFKFIDWMCSEEAQVLVNWGIEGVNYVVKDGKRVVPPEELQRQKTDPDYSATTGVGKWVYPFPEYGNAAVDSNGDSIVRDTRPNIIDGYLPVEKETLERYGVDMWIDLFPPSSTLERPVYGQLWRYALPKETNDLVLAADEYVKQMLIQCIISDPKEFDAKWNEMVATLKTMSMEEAGQTITDLIHQQLELWGIRSSK